MLHHMVRVFRDFPKTNKFSRGVQLDYVLPALFCLRWALDKTARYRS